MFWNKWQRKSLRFNLDNVFDKLSQRGTKPKWEWGK